ncbi:MAG: flagellar protein [Lachnospiraceae bacterium]|nr:flagellar protein [Lachnospiraceae bacterium]MDY5701015.1 TIGR02530 family flagellar biosynthesis protein [Lachnospiraceae bacterium]
MNLQRSQFLSINELQDQYLKKPVKNGINTNDKGLTFEEIWKEKTENLDEGLRFSKHATNRLADRSITLSNNQLDRLTEGARKAGEKGIRESLVMVDQLAFIVNVPNHTVITAMDQTETNENIFTNIDGAVIM